MLRGRGSQQMAFHTLFQDDGGRMCGETTTETTRSDGASCGAAGLRVAALTLTYGANACRYLDSCRETRVWEGVFAEEWHPFRTYGPRMEDPRVPSATYEAGSCT
ncbi:hypothetical protein CHU98_g82 [Xylaria longipes]|nr:hypothetical protein CHU98_g82 [Xylaria longipes]